MLLIECNITYMVISYIRYLNVGDMKSDTRLRVTGHVK